MSCQSDGSGSAFTLGCEVSGCLYGHCEIRGELKVGEGSRRGGHQVRHVVRPDASFVERGVCAGWCALLSRAPSASISRYSLRTKGVSSWMFKRPRRHCTSHALRPAEGCHRYRRHAH